jgi:hypothetical protein
MAAALLCGCAMKPEAIVADDEALCRYAEAMDGAQPYDQCRKKLEGQRTRVSTNSASRIEGYALLNGPAAQPPTGLAIDCKPSTNGKDCPSSDVTGTIPPAPKR